MDALARPRVSWFLIAFVSRRVYVQHVHKGRVRGILAELIKLERSLWFPLATVHVIQWVRVGLG